MGGWEQGEEGRVIEDYVYIKSPMIQICPCCKMPRVVEDYVVLYFGSSMFKIARLLFVALLSVHFFACTFYRVKNESAASPEDVQLFYTSRGVDPEVGQSGIVSLVSRRTTLMWFVVFPCRTSPKCM